MNLTVEELERKLYMENHPLRAVLIEAMDENIEKFNSTYEGAVDRAYDRGYEDGYKDCEKDYEED